MSSFLMEEIQNELDMANVEISKLKRRLSLTTKYKDDKKKEAKKYFDLCKLKDRQIQYLQEHLKNAIMPKFKIGQEVFIVINKIEKAKVEKVICTIAKMDDENSTWYSLTDIYGYALRLPEEQIFATREEAEQRLKELRGE